MLVEIERHEDERGYFARVFCHNEFEAQGLESAFLQESVSINSRAGTVRGFHFQKTPHEEAKLVTCLRGEIFDVILDVRPSSPTYGSWQSIILGSEDWKAIYVPPGCAHAYQALKDETELLYRTSSDYVRDAGAGYRWNSPDLGIPWPLEHVTISEADAVLPPFRLKKETLDCEQRLA